LFAHELDRIIELARECGADTDPIILDRLARAFQDLSAMKAMGDRILDAYVREGTLGPEASVSKLSWSAYHKRVAELGVDILGIDALEWRGDGPLRWYRADEPGAGNSPTSWLSVYLL